MFEGLDGAGKSTQVNSLADFLEDQGETVTISRWNSGKMSGIIKEYKNKISMNPKIYSLTHALDLIERYDDEIVPALDRDEVVICDRYFFTSYVRDSLRKSDIDHKNIFSNLRKPDIIFYLKANPRLCVERIKNRGSISYYAAGMDLFLSHDQDENLEQYFDLMNKEYDSLLKDDKTTYIIKSNREPKKISEDINKIVDNFLNGRKKS